MPAEQWGKWSSTSRAMDTWRRVVFTEPAALRFNADRYPESPNVHDSLGEAASKLGRLKEAQSAYRKAYDLGAAQQDGQTSTFKKNLDRVSERLSSN